MGVWDLFHFLSFRVLEFSSIGVVEFPSVRVFAISGFRFSGFRVVQLSGCRVFWLSSFRVSEFLSFGKGRSTPTPCLPPSFLFCFIVLALTCAWARLQPRPQLSKGAIATARPPLSFCTLRNVCVH